MYKKCIILHVICRFANLTNLNKKIGLYNTYNKRIYVLYFLCQPYLIEVNFPLSTDKLVISGINDK